MLLTYSFPQFEQAIPNLTKIHTLRADPNRRWQIAAKIHHWLGSPRNPKSNPRRITPVHGCDFDVCGGAEDVVIRRAHPQLSGGIGMSIEVRTTSRPWRVLELDEIWRFAANDGLNLDMFKSYFLPPGVDSWEGRIIHFSPIFTYAEFDARDFDTAATAPDKVCPGWLRCAHCGEEFSGFSTLTIFLSYHLRNCPVRLAKIATDAIGR